MSATTHTYTGAGTVSSGDYHSVAYVGKTKGGSPITIIMPNAFNKSNIDLGFAEKDDVVPELEFEGCYDEDTLASGDRKEPWTINYTEPSTGTEAIVLGVGKFYIGTAGATDVANMTCIGLTRGGGSFAVEREYREINADGDPGAVQGRIEKEGGRPKLKMKALQFLKNMATLYPCLTTVPAAAQS